MRENSSISNFKSSIFKIFSMTLFLVFIILFTTCLGNVYGNAASKNKINEWSRQRFDEFYATTPNTIDAVFLGSSHSYCTFDPEDFHQNFRGSSYQLGMPQQTPDSSYYTLLEVLNYQKPKVVVMELYWEILDNEFDARQVETFFKVLENEEFKKKYISNVPPLNERVKFNIDAIRLQEDFFAYMNSKINDYTLEEKRFKNPTLLVSDQKEGSEYYRSKGYIFCDYVMNKEEYEKINATSVATTNFEFAESQKYYLEKMVKTCEENDIKLIFVTAPISNISLSKIENYEDINKTIADFAKIQKIEYLDFNMVNKNSKIFSNENFRDAGHLNNSGAKIANTYFTKAFSKALD